MKRASQNDMSALRRLLRVHWKVDAVPSPNFRAEVWARIEALRSRPATWSEWLRDRVFPVCASVLVSVLLAAVLAGRVARTEARAAREREVERYVGSIDPHARAGVVLVAFQP